MTRHPDALSFPGASALLLLAIAGALSLSPAAASAQLPLHSSAGLGLALPAWSSPSLQPGYQLQVAEELDVARSPNAFRLQVLFDRLGAKQTVVFPAPPCAFGAKCVGGSGTVPGHEWLIAGTLDMLVAMPSSSAFTPYVVLGGGLFNHELVLSGEPTSSSNDVGGDLGAGLRLPWFHASVEMTAHFVLHGGDFIPIAVGVRF